jgi:hypothetical protein
VWADDRSADQAAAPPLQPLPAGSGKITVYVVWYEWNTTNVAGVHIKQFYILLIVMYLSGKHGLTIPAAAVRLLVLLRRQIIRFAKLLVLLGDLRQVNSSCGN